MAISSFPGGFADTQDNLKNLSNKYSVKDAGPYIGIVKDTEDPLRMGRLGVVIPALANVDGLDPTAGKVIWCQYLSPFYGAKPFKSVSKKDPYNFQHNQTSYGMWAVPPDIDTNVLVIFAKGQKSKSNAFWLGCIQEPLTNHMVPGLASSHNSKLSMDKVGPIDYKTSSGIGKQNNYGTQLLPVIEKNKKQYSEGEGIMNLSYWQLPVNEDLAHQLKVQGLIQDPVRGTTTSSARRETPSHVFGISTPGRLKSDTRTPNIGLEGEPVGVDRGIGHSFVMDDGASNGANQLVRLRTSSGHQVLLNDSEGIVYIANGSGNAWIEMDAEGKIDVYSGKGGIHLRTEGDFNLHSDQNINMHAGKQIRMSAKGEIITSGDMLLSLGEQGVLTSSMKGVVQTYGASAITSYTSGQQLHGAAGGTHLAGGQIHFNSIGYSPDWGPHMWTKEKLGMDPRDEGDVELVNKGGTKILQSHTRKTKTTVHRFVTHEPMFRYDAFTSEGVVPSQIDDDKMDTKTWSRLSSTPGTVEYQEQQNRISSNETLRLGQFQADAEKYLKEKMGNSTDSIKASKLLDEYQTKYDKTFSIASQAKGIFDQALSISNRIKNFDLESEAKQAAGIAINLAKTSITNQLTNQIIQKVKGTEAVKLFKDKLMVGSGGQIFTIGNIEIGKLNVSSAVTDVTSQLASKANDLSKTILGKDIGTHMNSVSTIYNNVIGGKITNSVFTNNVKHLPMNMTQGWDHITNFMGITNQAGGVKVVGGMLPGNVHQHSYQYYDKLMNIGKVGPVKSLAAFTTKANFLSNTKILPMNSAQMMSKFTNLMGITSSAGGVKVIGGMLPGNVHQMSLTGLQAMQKMPAHLTADLGASAFAAKGILPTISAKIGTFGVAIGNFFKGFIPSDVRLKEDIQLIGKSLLGTNIYSFKYKHIDGTYQGVMAQEVPWAREMTNTGFYIVDYSKLDVEFRRVH